MIVLDTNIVLDLLVFDDAQARTLRLALEDASVRWIATLAMREELERVLGYRHIVPRLACHALEAAAVLAQFDRLARIAPVAARAALRCQDADDQKFVDLALAHRACLVSKDRAVLSLARRTLPLGVSILAHWAPGPGKVQGAAPDGAAEKNRDNSVAVCEGNSSARKWPASSA